MDESVAAVYAYLDFVFPDAKFILTERDETSWLESVKKHRTMMHSFLANPTSLRQVLGPSVSNKTLATFPYGNETAVFSRSVRALLEERQVLFGLVSRKKVDRFVEWAFTQVTLYGQFEFNEAAFVAGFRRHYAGVSAHFARRPDRLLRMNICSGGTWEPLCGFLGVPIPTVPFPHEHRSAAGSTPNSEPH
jgi:hypothetical protein